MKILSFSSKEINNILLKQGAEIESIGESGLIETIYYEEEIKNELKTTEQFKTIDNISSNKDVVIFDFLSLCNNQYSINNKIYNEETLRRIYTDKQLQAIENKKITDDLIDIFRAAFKVIINKISKKYHPSKIVLLNIIFKEESEENKKKNDFLKHIYKEAKKNLPGSITIDINVDGKVINEDLELFSEIENKVINLEKFKNEKVFTSINNIRYIFKKAKVSNANKLIIIFSSFPNDIPKYNYISFFKTIDCNKLFILDDYGDRGSYYLGVDGNLEIETSVMSLISSIMSKNNICFKDVISIGSSKGGSAALYYGFKYGFGNIIVGAPQYKIGTYLSDLSIKQYAIDIFGDINSSTRITYDNLIRLVLTNENNTKARILTSDGDKQYKKILKPLEHENLLGSYGMEFDKCEINNHGEIANVYPGYLLEALSEIMEGKGIYSNTPIINIMRKITKKGR